MTKMIKAMNGTRKIGRLPIFLSSFSKQALESYGKLNADRDCYRHTFIHCFGRERTSSATCYSNHARFNAFEGHCHDDFAVVWSKLFNFLKKEPFFSDMKLLLEHQEENIRGLL